MLPSFADLSITTKHGKRWSISEATEFLSNVHEALTRIFASMDPPLDPPIRDKIMEMHVTQYLTQTFTPHKDLTDRTKNAVLWSTAMFIENRLTDWGLSGGFYVNGIRFANNDVKNLLDERDSAMELFDRTRQNLQRMKLIPPTPTPTPTLTPTPTPTPPSNKSSPAVAFLYIWVRKLGFTKGPDVPHLLLIGHVNSGYRKWGVPGGLRDRGDKSTLFCAMREMCEELLGMHPSTNDVNNMITKANNVGTFKQLIQTSDNYTAWMFEVDSALNFEMQFGLPKRTIIQKYNAPLSNETKGYLWIPFPLDVSRKKPSDPWIVKAPAELQHRPLILRKGVLGPSKLIK
jgi:hypothetical protein